MFTILLLFYYENNAIHFGEDININLNKITNIGIDPSDNGSVVNLGWIKSFQSTINSKLNENRELINNSVYLDLFDAYINFSNPQNLILRKKSYGIEISGVKIIGDIDGVTSSFTINKNISHYFGKDGMDITGLEINNLNIQNIFTFCIVFEHKQGISSYITFTDSNNQKIFSININDKKLVFLGYQSLKLHHM